MSSGQGSPISSVEKRPTTTEDKVSFVEDAWQYLSMARQGLEQQWKEHIHFFSGDQWIKYMPHNRAYVKHALDEWVPTPVTNIFVEHVDRIADIFTSGDILPLVDAATQDQMDLDAARAATRMLHSEFGRLETEERMILPAALWIILTGNCFTHAGWNARSGREVRKPKMRIVSDPIESKVLECANCGRKVPLATGLVDCPQCGQPLQEGSVHALDAVGQPLHLDREEPISGSFDTFTVGDIEETLVSPMNFYPERSLHIDNCRYAIEVEAMSVDQIKSIWGSKASDIVAESLDVQDYGAAYGQAFQTHYQPDREKKKDHALVKYLRHVPDRRWKDGMFTVVVNDFLLHDGRLDSTDGELGYTHFKYRNIPGQFWGGSLAQDLVPQQKRLNAIDSHVVANRKQMVSNQWLVPEGSGVTKVDGRSGLVIPWTPSTAGGFKPERLQGVPLPNQVMEEREQVKSDMEIVSGAREVLSGDIPPGPETGAAVEAIQEQAFRRFGPLVKSWRAGWARHEHRKLKLMAAHWDEKRIVKVTGENSDLESFYLSKADIRQAQDMTVRVGIGMDYSQSAHRQKIMQAAQMGLLGDIADPAVRGKIMERLEIKGFESEYTLDARKARRFLEMMKVGEAVPEPEIIDSHSIQFQVYKDYMLTSDFEQLPPPTQDTIRQRVQIHQQAMQQEKQEALMAAEAAKGAPDQAAQGIAQAGIGQPSVPVQQ